MIANHEDTGVKANVGWSSLPILTTDGKGVFDVTTIDDLEDSNSQRTRLNPVFNLPSIEPRSLWDVNCHQAVVSMKRERDERKVMQHQLGLSDEDIRELENELSSGANGIKKAMAKVVTTPTPIDLISKKSKRTSLRLPRSLTSATKPKYHRKTITNTHQQRYQRGAECHNDPKDTATHHKEKVTTSLTQRSTYLRRQLGTSLSNIQTFEHAVKNDIIEMRRLYPPLIMKTKPRVRKILAKWAAEKMIQIWDGVASSLLTTAFCQWRHSVRLLIKREKMVKYMKYQSLQKIYFFYQRVLKRKTAQYFLDWIDFTERLRQIERWEFECSQAQILQCSWRRRIAITTVSRLRASRKMAAAILLQSVARMLRLRKVYCRIMLEKATIQAAKTVQCAYRSKVALDKLRHLQFEKKKRILTIIMQRMFRGYLGRRSAATLKIEKKKRQSAINIQRVLRGRWGSLQAKERLLFLRQSGAAMILQKRARIIKAKKVMERQKQEKERYLLLRRKAVLNLQRAYRGHRGRIMVKLQMRTHVAVVRRRHRASMVIQCWMRIMFANDKVRKLTTAKREEMIKNARIWHEKWSDDDNTWFYQNVETNETLWEPPPIGYKKHDTRLVLQDGKVVIDPLETVFEDQQAMLKENICVDCENSQATRQCDQCGDKYCTNCFISAHPKGGKRESHTYVRIGPIECEDCAAKLAVRWCTQCDDPFCQECWEKVHTSGNRMFHRYCMIDTEGNVSPRAWEVDGSPAGVFPQGNRCSAPAEEHSFPIIKDQDQPDYENFNTPHNIDPSWTLFYDDNGVPYYYNQLTGESTYDVKAHEQLQQGAFEQVSTDQSQTNNDTVQEQYWDPNQSYY